jgi:amidase
MPKGARLPSVDQIVALATDLGMDMTQAEAASYQTLMKGAINSYRRIDEFAENKPRVKYPRDPGYRPGPEENPYGAWYVKTNIKGAKNGPLSGMRVAVKDAVSVAGVPMMGGTILLEGFTPDIDATVITRLLDAGATIAGKVHTEDHSFSAGSHTTALGPTRNPRKPTHTVGGSSSGSAAVLVTGEVELAIGADQGGSIRIPAAWSGVVGLKPTYGLVPYTGAMSLEMTLDHLGPMANSVEDVAKMLSVMAGPDPLDPRQRGVIPVDYVRDYRSAIGKGCKGLKIAVVKEGFDQLEREDLGLPGSEVVVDRKVRAAIAQLKKRGAIVTEVSVPMHPDGVHLWNGIILEGANESVWRGNGGGCGWQGLYNTKLIETYGRAWRSQPNDLPVTAKTVVLLGEYMHRNYYGRYYAKSQNVRGQLRAAYDAVLASHDVLVMPTVPFRAQAIPSLDCSLEDTMFYALAMINNTPQFDVSGHPAISVPCGLEDDLPIGMMIVGKHFDDLTVLRAADAFEKVGDWKTM